MTASAWLRLSRLLFVLADRMDKLARAAAARSDRANLAAVLRMRNRR
jgi:hypothetical protein